jgi:hypothetical protein
MQFELEWYRDYLIEPDQNLHANFIVFNHRFRSGRRSRRAIAYAHSIAIACANAVRGHADSLRHSAAHAKTDSIFPAHAEVKPIAYRHSSSAQ